MAKKKKKNPRGRPRGSRNEVHKDYDAQLFVRCHAEFKARLLALPGKTENERVLLALAEALRRAGG